MPQLLITATYGHDHSTRAATVQKIDAKRYPQLLMEYGTLGLGPFPVGSVAFRFRCGHTGCKGDAALCRGEEFAVEVSETL
jgi:hypothetical protein